MIYFIESGPGGPIKIGYVDSPDRQDVESRMGLLQVGNPADLRILAVQYGAIDEERELHKRFAAGRIRGEWFGPETPGLSEAINHAVAHERVVAWQLRDDGLQICEWCEIAVVQPPRRTLCSERCSRERREFLRTTKAEMSRNPPVLPQKHADLQADRAFDGDGGNRTHERVPS